MLRAHSSKEMHRTVDRDFEQLTRVLMEQGITKAAVSSTIGRSQGHVHVPGHPRPSTLPAADVGEEADQEFVIRRLLGRGGMATVWLADQPALAREVAIKRVSDPGDGDAHLLLLREAVITGQLEHPNVVPVHVLAFDEDGPAVVMKRVTGESWESLIARKAASVERHLDILLQVINAVAFAHSRGVLHRDIKPANVMIGDFGEVYLVDWGIARRDSDPQSDAIVGTPNYMAPELAEGRADERTDVFLLGATLHEVITGKPRHQGVDAITVLYAAMYVEPYDYGSGVPDELAAIINQACARSPSERFQNVLTMREAITVYREHRAAQALSTAAGEQLMEMEQSIRDQPANYTEGQRRFSVARFGFDAALKVWPESPHARFGLARCLRVMIDYEIEQRHLDVAEALIATLSDRDPERVERAARVSAMREQLRTEQARLLAIVRDRDPRVGAADRAKAYRAMAAAVLLMTLALFAQRLFFAGFSPSSLRLVLVAVIVLMLMIGILIWWRKHGEWNFINRRIAEISVATLAVSFANRLSGVMTNEAPFRVLIADALIIGLGGAAMSAYFRAGPVLAAMSFLVAILGSAWPDAVDEMFIGLSVFVPALVLLLKRAGLMRPVDQDEPVP